MAYQLNTPYHFVSHAGYGYNLNLSGNHLNDAIPNGNPLILYYGNTRDQLFRVRAHNGHGRIYCQTNLGYVLNMYSLSQKSCVAWPASAASDSDSLIETRTINTDQQVMKIELVGRGLFLTAANGSGEDVSWQTNNNDYSNSSGNKQAWKLVPHTKGRQYASTSPGGNSSPVVSVYTKLAHISRYNYVNKNREQDGYKISKITIHHMAGTQTVQSQGEVWSVKSKENIDVSSHYGVKDNAVGQYVYESNVAFTDNNMTSNRQSVTIEVSNSSRDGQWPVSAASLNSLIMLVAEIARRNNFGKVVKGTNLTWHKMYANTACPGEYLLGKIDYIAQQANKLNGY